MCSRTTWSRPRPEVFETVAKTKIRVSEAKAQATQFCAQRVVTRLRCGGITNDCCIANFLEIITVKEL